MTYTNANIKLLATKLRLIFEVVFDHSSQLDLISCQESPYSLFAYFLIASTKLLYNDRPLLPTCFVVSVYSDLRRTQ